MAEAYGIRPHQDDTDEKEEIKLEEAADPLEEATVSVGLKAKQLTKEERVKFRGKSSEYLEIRDQIILKWYQSCTHALTVEQCLEGVPPSKQQLARRAHAFLQEQGYLNFGVATEPVKEQQPEPEAPEPEAEAAAQQPGADAGSSGAGQPELSPEEAAQKQLVFKLYEILRTADLGALSAKMIRKQLEEELGRDLKEHMPLLRQHIDYFVSHVEEKDTLVPMGYEEKLVRANELCRAPDCSSWPALTVAACSQPQLRAAVCRL